MSGPAGARGDLNFHHARIGGYGYSDRVSNPDPNPVAILNVYGILHRDVDSHPEPDALAGSDRNAIARRYANFDGVSNQDANSLRHTEFDGYFHADRGGRDRYASRQIPNSHCICYRGADAYTYAGCRSDSNRCGNANENQGCRGGIHCDCHFNSGANGKSCGVVAAAASARNRGGAVE